MSNKTVIGEYLRKNSSIYGIVPTSNNQRIDYSKKENFLNENKFHVFGFSDKNIATKNFLLETPDNLRLKRNLCNGAALSSLMFSGYLAGIALTSFAYKNPEIVCWSSFMGVGILMTGSLFLDNLSNKIGGEIERRHSNIETILSKTNVNVLNDAKNYVLKSREKKFSENKINKGLNKIYLENIL